MATGDVSLFYLGTIFRAESPFELLYKVGGWGEGGNLLLPRAPSPTPNHCFCVLV